jgi:hypothetical protein
MCLVQGCLFTRFNWSCCIICMLAAPTAGARIQFLVSQMTVPGLVQYDSLPAFVLHMREHMTSALVLFPSGEHERDWASAYV